jgi:cysteinyl-tRNA synthetase
MIEYIKILLERGFAYRAKDGIYFDITKFPRYGMLSGNPLEKLMAGARIEINPNKKNPLDFALWKYDPKHIMQWDSPWGKGFPGWHIECSVMSSKYLGQPIDIHTGGEDNIFPHHESEIAQSESAYDKKFVNYWLHVRHLMVEGRKMSKSEKNFYTVRDIFDKGYSPIVLRYILLSAHYRQHLNFTFDGLESARSAVLRLLSFRDRLLSILQNTDVKPSNYAKSFSEKFITVMDNDLNMPEGLATIFDFVWQTNKAIDKGEVRIEDIKSAFDGIMEVDRILGIIEMYKPQIEDEALELIKKRDYLRRIRNFQEADKIRKNLAQRGILLEDTKEGTRWYKL